MAFNFPISISEFSANSEFTVRVEQMNVLMEQNLS